MKPRVSPALLRKRFGLALLSSVAIVGALQAGPQSNDAMRPWASADEAVIGTAVTEATGRIQKLATKDPGAFAAILRQAFGLRLDAETERLFVHQAAHRQLPLPRHILFVADEVVAPAVAAYASGDGGTILIGARSRTDTQHLPDLILHEWGHHLDALLGPGDSPLEEGEVFHLGVKHGKPIAAALAQRHAPEYGHATIEFEGRRIAVEQFGFIKSAVNAVGAGLAAVGNGLAAAGKAVVNTAKGAAQAVAAGAYAIAGDSAKANSLLAKAGSSFESTADNLKDVGNSALDIAATAGNVINETSAALNKVVPHLGTALQIAGSFTPAAVGLAAAKGIADVKNGFENGGLKGALTAGAFAALDVGGAVVGRAAKGIKAAKAAGAGSNVAVATSAAAASKAGRFSRAWTAVKSGAGKAKSAVANSKVGKLASKGKGAVEGAVDSAKAKVLGKYAGATKAEIARATKWLDEGSSIVNVVKYAGWAKNVAKVAKVGNLVRDSVRDEDGGLLATEAAKVETDAASIVGSWQSEDCTLNFGVANSPGSIFDSFQYIEPAYGLTGTYGFPESGTIVLQKMGTEESWRCSYSLRGNDLYLRGNDLSLGGKNLDIAHDGERRFTRLDGEAKAKAVAAAKALAIQASGKSAWNEKLNTWKERLDTSPAEAAKVKADAASIVGSWQSDEHTLSFGVADSPAAIFDSFQHIEPADGLTGTYGLPEPGTIVLQKMGTEESWSWSYSLRGNHLYLKGNDLSLRGNNLDIAHENGERRFTRLDGEAKAKAVAAAKALVIQCSGERPWNEKLNTWKERLDTSPAEAAKVKADAASIVGSWQSDELILTFGENKAFEFNEPDTRLSGTFSFPKPGTIVLQKKGTDESWRWSYSVRGDNLDIVHDDGKRRFTRLDAQGLAKIQGARKLAAAQASVVGSWQSEDETLTFGENHEFQYVDSADRVNGTYSFPKPGTIVLRKKGTDETVRWSYSVRGDNLDIVHDDDERRFTRLDAKGLAEVQRARKLAAAQASVVGSWQSEDRTLTFGENKEFVYIDARNRLSGTYSFPEAGIVLLEKKGTDESWRWSYSLSGNNLDIDYGGDKRRFTRLDARALAKVQRSREQAAAEKAREVEEAQRAREMAAAKRERDRKEAEEAQRARELAAAKKARDEAETDRRSHELAARRAREKAAREKAAREKAAREKDAREKAERDRRAREAAAAKKAAREKAERERRARALAAAKKAAREKAARERRARELAARRAREKAAREKAERDRRARELAARRAREKAAREKAERDRRARALAAAKKAAREKAAREQAERERRAREAAVKRAAAASRAQLIGLWVDASDNMVTFNQNGTFSIAEDGNKLVGRFSVPKAGTVIFKKGAQSKSHRYTVKGDRFSLVINGKWTQWTRYKQ